MPDRHGRCWKMYSVKFPAKRMMKPLETPRLRIFAAKGLRHRFPITWSSPKVVQAHLPRDGAERPTKVQPDDELSLRLHSPGSHQGTGGKGKRPSKGVKKHGNRNRDQDRRTDQARRFGGIEVGCKAPAQR